MRSCRGDGNNVCGIALERLLRSGNWQRSGGRAGRDGVIAGRHSNALLLLGVERGRGETIRKLSCIVVLGTTGVAVVFRHGSKEGDGGCVGGEMEGGCGRDEEASSLVWAMQVGITN